MMILKSDDILFVDCDDTLVLWGPKEHPDDEEVVVKDAYMPGKDITLVKHQRNIDLIKRNKGAGRTIVVWSAGGVFHAQAVVKALKLQEYVDLIIAKPTQYVDDLDIKEWGCKRIYLGKFLREHPKEGDVDETKNE